MLLEMCERKMLRHCFDFIQQAITESIFPQISKATKSKEAWDTLQTKYQSTSLVLVTMY